MNQPFPWSSLAKETIKKYHLEDRVDLRLGEMNHLPFADSTVQAVVMNQVLHHAVQPGDVIKEVNRILSVEGVLVIADLTRHQQDWARERLADQWLGFSFQELEKWLQESAMGIISYQEYGDGKRQQSVFLLAAGSR